MLSAISLADCAQAFEKPATTRRYLQGPMSERLIVLYREGKITLGEVVHERVWREMPYRAQVSQGLWLMASDADGAIDVDRPLDFAGARLRVDADGCPVLGQSWRIGDLEVDLEACSPFARRSTAYGRLRLANRGGSPLRKTMAFVLRTGHEAWLVDGAPDLYCQYDPDRSYGRWRLIAPSWERCADGVFRDGDRFAAFSGGLAPTWDRQCGAVRFAVELEPGGERTLDFAFGKGRKAVPDYAAAVAQTRADWARELSRVDGRSQLVRNLVVQMLQCFSRPTEGDFVLPRQGGLQRYVWPAEAMEVMAALTALGYDEYVESALDFLWGEYACSDGSVGPFANDWASDTGSVLASFARHCLETGKREFWLRHRDAAERAFGWMSAKRRESAGREGCVKGLFPPMKSTDSTRVFQHWGMTDVSNWRAVDFLARAAARFGDPLAPRAAAEAADYRAAIAGVLDTWRRRSEGKDTFFIPLAPDGSNEAALRAAGFFYLHPSAFADSGLLTADEMVRLRNWLLREGIASEAGLYQRHPSSDPRLGRNVWYTTWTESQWFRAWMRVGRRDLAEEALKACLEYSVTAECQVGERIREESPWYFPWSPNASGAGRIVQMLLGLESTENNKGVKQ